MTPDIQSKTMDHLGLVAGMYDELSLVRTMLCRQEFSCEADAASALEKFEKKCRHIVVSHQAFVETAK